MKRLLQILILFCSQFILSQQDSIIRGKIIVETNDNDGINIVNISNKSNTISTNGGYFKLKAKVNDTIVFSAIHLVAKKHIVTKKDFGSDLLFIKLEIYSKRIKEIMVTSHDNVNAETLGLVPKGQKKYTPAERRLKTASDIDGQFGLNTHFGIDPLLNAISGRTKQLKAELEVERKEFLQKKINNSFDSDYIMNTLHIPEDYINGFIFYIVEDKQIVEASKAKNKQMVSFRMSQLAVEYLKLNNLEPYNPKPKEPENKTEEELKTEIKETPKPETESKKDE
ncbi:hypothetical protein [Flavobacterium urocaniciphilum]|uniref:CarboxypepD_reg-like domain-containing protein n=1 Tax=Flavobacterium urocaniciphilum TaxID=1299341 RepID=A0A1H9AMW5_9FLAO|nr:hypothetical protein [Flavobacterium urocaniciphilum]SEP77895.1 hypothetical protein SAMN05444005_102232 [Flavobacterium urocaniciphilum]